MEEFEIEFKELDQFEIEDVREVVVQEVPTFPALENLTVTPTTEEQVFNHENSYGYDEVRVEPVQGKSLEVTPSNEEQSFSDLYTNIKVKGDEDLLASNIKQGVEIFGVTGSLEELTTETKEGINNQEEIITNQETTLEKINQVIQDKILVKEKYKPRYFYNYQLFKGYTGTELDHEVSMLDTSYFTDMQQMFNENKNIVSLDLSGWNTSNVTNMNSMFSYCSSLTNLVVSGWNTSNVTTMQQMFNRCSKLITLDLSDFDTSNVTNMSGMFSYCNFTELDLSNFDTSSVTNMNGMFSEVEKLVKLDLSNFDTSNVTNMFNMFSFCYDIKELNLSSFKITPNTNIGRMFYYCRKLAKLDIRNFVFDGVTSYSNMFSGVPTDCLIIVKGETEKQWVLTQRSDLTNVKTIAELEG